MVTRVLPTIFDHYIRFFYQTGKPRYMAYNISPVVEVTKKGIRLVSHHLKPLTYLLILRIFSNNQLIITRI
jgi:hypothetical protein